MPVGSFYGSYLRERSCRQGISSFRKPAARNDRPVHQEDCFGESIYTRMVQDIHQSRDVDEKVRRATD